jgi:tRNA threonylcarbamoyladenosine biosynthesis protein TsaE
MPGPISSPTFVFINEYQPSQPGPYLYHVDLYRVKYPIEAVALGLEDYMYGDGVTVIEWAERARDIMPVERLWVTLSFLDYAKRSLLFEATGDRYLKMLALLRTELYPRKG